MIDPARIDEECAAFARRVQLRRKEAGLSQAEFAKRASMTQGAISAFEGGRGSPSLVTVLRLANALGISAARFFKD
ncbi:helix-turn-helix domain-containing protein [Rhizorhabdus argentea]|uniref:helix-turn-helix domain-containing protein n=1 Tax=Rhizorhabdus argentea TaxID=1387174 RepID=UPI0030EB8906